MTGGRAVLLVEFLTCLLLLRCATVSSNTRKIVNRFLPDAQSEYEMCRATVHADAVTHCNSTDETSSRLQQGHFMQKAVRFFRFYASERSSMGPDAGCGKRVWDHLATARPRSNAIGQRTAV